MSFLFGIKMNLRTFSFFIVKLLAPLLYKYADCLRRNKTNWIYLLLKESFLFLCSIRKYSLKRITTYALFYNYKLYCIFLFTKKKT